jgi:hypothetical protein
MSQFGPKSNLSLVAALIAGAGVIAILLSLILDHARAPESFALLIMRDLFLHGGVALLIAVAVGVVIERQLRSSREMEVRLQEMAEVFRRAFLLRSAPPWAALPDLMNYFLEVEWLRGDIYVDIDLSAPGDPAAGLVPPGMLLATTRVRYPIWRISDHRATEVPVFNTVQKLSPIAPGVPLGEVLSVRLTTEGRVVADISDRAVLSSLTGPKEDVLCFEYPIPCAQGDSVEVDLSMKRYLHSGTEDPCGSRIPARSLTITVRLDDARVQVSAFQYRPTRVPGWMRSQVRLTPVSTRHPVPGNPDQLSTYVFVMKPLLPLDSIVLRPSLRLTGA